MTARLTPEVEDSIHRRKVLPVDNPSSCPFSKTTIPQTTSIPTTRSRSCGPTSRALATNLSWNVGTCSRSWASGTMGGRRGFGSTTAPRIMMASTTCNETVVSPTGRPIDQHRQLRRARSKPSPLFVCACPRHGRRRSRVIRRPKVAREVRLVYEEGFFAFQHWRSGMRRKSTIPAGGLSRHDTTLTTN